MNPDKSDPIKVCEALSFHVNELQEEKGLKEDQYIFTKETTFNCLVTVICGLMWLVPRLRFEWLNILNGARRMLATLPFLRFCSRVDRLFGWRWIHGISRHLFPLSHVSLTCITQTLFPIAAGSASWSRA